jgi:hypothetical protein
MNYIKLIRGGLMSLCLLMAVGCDSDDSSVTNISANFAQLDDDSTVTLLENSGTTIEIGIILGGPQATDTQIEFDVTGDVSRFELSSPSLSIPAGETNGLITLTAIDDDEINGDLVVVVALSASSSVPVGLVGQGSGYISKTINIIDDNIPCNDYVVTIVADRWGSEVTYDLLDANGDTIISGGPFSDTGADTTTEEITELTLADGCYTLRVFDYYGDSWNGGGGAYSIGCGSAIFSGNADAFAGIPGLDLSTLPPNLEYDDGPFRPGSSTSATPPYEGHAAQIEFCVNQ